MKKLLFTACVVLLALSFASAQSNNNSDIIDPNNLAALQKMPKSTRDSLVISLKKSAKLPKNNSVKINGEDRSAVMAKPMGKFSAAMAELMIAVLSSDDPAVAQQSQQKYFALKEQLDKEMDTFSDQLDYEEDRQKIIDKFNEGKYDDAREKREAKKEMNEDLRELKKDFKEKLKDQKEKEKKRAEREARREKKG